MANSTAKSDMPTLEPVFTSLWRRVQDLNVELKRNADSRWVSVKLEQALDEALVDYTHWRAASVKPRLRG
jgi:hypothetical protein